MNLGINNQNHSNLQFDDVTILQHIISLNELTIKHRCSPYLGAFQFLSEVLMNLAGKIGHGAALFQNKMIFSMLAFHYWQHFWLKLGKFDLKVNRLCVGTHLSRLILGSPKRIPNRNIPKQQKGNSHAMKEEWINAFGKLTYGIYVLTSHHEEKINGMIASWVSQVSYEPPLIMVAVHPNRFSHQLIEHGGGFALHVLADTQADFLSRFKGADVSAKFSTINWTLGKTGCPILSECLAYLECELKTHYRPGNHTLFIGEVIAAGVLAHQKPFTTREYDGVYLGKV